MHSIEVIISLLFLFLVFGLIIFSISFQNENFEIFLEKKEGLFSSNNCGALIDTAFSNSLETINAKGCFGKENVVHGNNPKKTSKIITSVTKDFYLEVEINEHYQN